MSRATAAIDFGTTYCSVAYKLPDSSRIIPVAPGCLASSRQETETSVLLELPGNFVAFGRDATVKFELAHETGRVQVGDRWIKKEDLILFKHFKMNLYNATSKEPMVESIGFQPTSLPLKTLVRFSLEYLSEFLLTVLRERHDLSLKMREIQWVVTVPAIWTESQKKLMRSAAEEANMCTPGEPDRLLFALEPEAAAIAIQKSEDNRTFLKEGKAFMIVDLGGGTADITQYRINSSKFDEIAPPFGGDWGSTNMDKAFEDLLAQVIGRPRFQGWKERHPREYHEVMSNFITKKESGSESFTTKINGALARAFTKQSVDRYNDYHLGMPLRYFEESSALQLTESLLASLCKSAIDRLIESLLPHTPNVDKILMVGGFSNSPFVRRRIRSAFGANKVIFPSDGTTVVVRGGVLFGVDEENIIASRIAPVYYGTDYVLISPDRPEGFSESAMTYNSELKRYEVRKAFSEFIRRGESIPAGRKVKKTYVPHSQGQRAVKIGILYSNGRTSPRTCNEATVHTLAEITIPINPAIPKEDNAISVEMDFGRTELKVEAKSLQTSAVKQVSIDFDLVIAPVPSLLATQCLEPNHLETPKRNHIGTPKNDQLEPLKDIIISPYLIGAIIAILFALLLN